MESFSKVLISCCCGGLLCSCSNRPTDDYEPIVEYHPRSIANTQKLYIVQDGDTVGSIATAYDVTRAEIIKLNNLMPPYELIPGQKLIIPTKPVDAEDLNALSSSKSLKASNVTIVQEGGLQTEYTDTKNDDNLPTLASSLKLNESEEEPLIENSAVQLGTTQELTNSETTSDLSTETPSSTYVWPVANGRSRITKKFDQQSGNILISTPGKTPVKAIADGIVKMAGKSGNEQLVRFGNMIVIQHKSLSKVSIYANVIDLKVKPGQSVSGGDTIASVGQSGIRGMTTTPALYFEIDKTAKGQKRQPVDPCTILP